MNSTNRYGIAAYDLPHYASYYKEAIEPHWSFKELTPSAFKGIGKENKF
jgi:hypothetical protein